MLRAPMRVRIAVALVAVASAQGQNRPLGTAARRLQAAQTALASNPDPGALLAQWPLLAGDLLQLVRAQSEGQLSASQLPGLADAPAVSWTRLQGAWLLLYGGAVPSAASTAFLRTLGVLPPENGTADPLAFFVALEALSPQADGTFQLAAGVQAARATLLPALRAAAPAETPPGDAVVAARLKEGIWWDDLARIRTWPLVTGNYFRVVARADLPWPPAGQPLARAFAEVAAGGPDQYATKWWAHGVLLGQLERLLRREEAANHAAALAFHEAYYRLLCHAVIPVTVFRPRAADSSGQVHHFSRVWEEDQPLQGIFSREGHLLQVTTLQGLLGKATLEGFDPGRHIFLVPFDAAGSGDRWQVRSRRYGYLGYLDAMATRNYPFLLRPYLPERAHP